MLPQRKYDNSFLSVPVSRVGSSQRLNQIAAGAQGTSGGAPSSPSNPYTSIPSTPSGYVSSSLNPSRNSAVVAPIPGRVGSGLGGIGGLGSGPNQTESNEFENIPLVQNIRRLEEQLTVLSQDIASYREDRIPTTISRMIKLNASIFELIDEMKRQQELAKRTKELQLEKSRLDTLAKDTLKTFLEYRAQLKLLPSLSSQKKSSGANKGDLLDVKEVLKYAMRLSKFTKMPSSSADSPMNIHPNNFVWPAEDALRRGMLALSSLHEEEVVRQELGDQEIKGGEKEADGVKLEKFNADESKLETVDKIQGSDSVNKEETRDNDSDVSMEPAEEKPEATQKTAKAEKSEKPKMIDLDLFDPEDDFSD